MQLIPQDPTAQITKVNELSTVSTIVVSMPEVESFGEAAGGAEITSYNLEYNNGQGS